MSDTRAETEGYWHKAKCPKSDSDYSVICDCHVELRQILEKKIREAEKAYFDSVLRSKVKNSPDMTVKEWHDRLYAKHVYAAAQQLKDSKGNNG